MDDDNEDSLPFLFPINNIIIPLPNIQEHYAPPQLQQIALNIEIPQENPETLGQQDSVEVIEIDSDSGVEDTDERTENLDDRWNLLPELVIVEIFSYLDDGERFNASLVCKKWSSLFKSPTLWRNRRFRFNGRNSQKAIGFARNVGQYLENLTVAACHPTLYGCRKFQKNIAEFLNELTRNRSRLRTLCVTQLYVERYWRTSTTRDKLANCLSRFLRCQRGLRQVDVSEAMIPLFPGIRMLEGLASGSGRTIYSINIEDYFHPRQSVFIHARYLAAIRRFTNLRTLHLNYNCISNEVLEILAENCADTLKNFFVKIYKHDPHHHVINGLQWKALHRACRHLQVQMYFEGIAQYDVIRKIAISESRLVNFYIWTGVHLNSEEMGLNMLLKHLGNSFPNSLQDVSLNLENTHDVVDDGILYLLEKCKKLKNFDLQAVILISTAEEICKMQVEYKTGLSKLHIGIEGLTISEMEDLERVVEEYEDVMDERGVDFRLLANEDYPFL